MKSKLILLRGKTSIRLPSFITYN